MRRIIVLLQSLAIAAVTVVVASVLVTTGGAVSQATRGRSSWTSSESSPRRRARRGARSGSWSRTSGTVKHEFVVLKTAKPAGNLLGNARQTRAGNVGDDRRGVLPGQAKTVTLTLKPGHYSLICNLRGALQGSVRGLLRPVGNDSAVRHSGSPFTHRGGPSTASSARGSRRYTPRMRKYAVWGAATSPELTAWVESIGREFERDDFTRVDDIADADFVLNMFDADQPRAFRRQSRGTYSASFYELDAVPEDVLKTSYPMLVRTLANVVVLHVPGHGVWFTTMERGTYKISDEPREVFERLAPLAKSKLVIDNEFVADLEPELWDGDEVTADIGTAGKRMQELDLLPAPFPVHEYLDERDLRHVMRLYQVGGLSYGNLSARKDATRFWMSASGVDKSQLEVAGRDILLVTGYDEPNAKMMISVPPGIEPRRVSVDAIEHWMIYQAHPDVGAILHVHAWMEGIAATDINYPCGTQELAESVAELIEREPDPSHAVIGLRNHGITATGGSLTEILDRIESSILRQVPMT